MAILDEIEVRVYVNGVPAREFDDDDETEDYQPNTTCKYVEAVSGAPFYFSTRLSSAYHMTVDILSVCASLDGKYMTGQCIRRETHNNSIIGSDCKIASAWSGHGKETQLLEFQFGDLETRDMAQDDNVTELKEKYSDLGLMTIEVWEEKFLGETREHNTGVKTNSNEPVPEKALKGRPLAVSTTLKPVPFTKRSASLRTRRIGNEPFAVFKFKYRTKRALQSLLILPRSESPVPLEQRTVEELSPEELRELVRRQRIQAEIKIEGQQKLKRERAATISEPARPLKTSRTSDGKTIYHLDSDDEDGVKDESLAKGKEKEKAKASSPVEDEIEVVTLL